MWRRSLRRIAFVGIALGLALVMVSSAYVYAVSKRYTRVYDDANFTVWLRVDMINAKPRKFAVVLCSLKVHSKSPSDIVVHEFSVQAYSSPPGSPGAKEFGAKTVWDLLIPANGTVAFKLNVKVTNWMYFTGADEVWVVSYINWTHFGQTYERYDSTSIDITPWKSLIGA